MAIFKISLRIIFLILLCIPIVYIQYYIIRSTAADVMNNEKKRPSEALSTKRSYHPKEHLRVAK